MGSQKDLNEHSLAYEMLKQMKADAKRWFIIALVELIIILGIAGIFIWYISLPSEQYDVMVENEDGNANYIGNDMKGNINNGTN